MPKLLRAQRIFALDPASASGFHRWTGFGAKLVFWPLALLTLAALALQLGARQREYKVAGPFAAETNPARHSLILAVPQDTRPKWWIEPLVGDDNEHPFQSRLDLRIDGRKMGPPHREHETIREGTTAGFSHWGSYVVFSLPPDIQNAPDTVATLRYNVRPRAWLTLALTVSSALLGWLLYSNALRSLARGYGEPPAAVLLRIPYLLLFGLCCVGLIGSTAYVVSSLYAFATGWALPTTALIRWLPIAQWAATNEPYFGHLLITLAGFGASVTWLVGLNVHLRRPVESNELTLRRFLAWSGFPITACAFIFCISAMWAGMIRPGDPSYANIGGLIPFSDGADYLSASYDQAKDGFWNFVASRRALAAAFRSVILVFGNFSLQYMLILQACLVAVAVCFATHAVAMWRGLWAGIAFFSLTYIYTRHFVPTTLTEPLGLFWALVSVPFFIDAFVSGSVRPALVAFAMTTVALMTRMGSMFTIPALLVWLVWQFGRDTRAKFKIFAAAIGILLGILGLNSVLQNAFGTAASSNTGNFAYVLCGLTMGTTWEGCPAKLASEGKTLPKEEEGGLAKQLYSMAWENFNAAPGVFFERLADNVQKFVMHFPDAVWKGHGVAIEEPDWLPRQLLTQISLIGLAFIAIRRLKAVELAFWILLWVSIIASASMVYGDEGSRVLAASHPLIALFFAIGISSPVLAPVITPSRPKLSRYGALGLIATAALFVCVPWIAYRFSPIEVVASDSLLRKHDEALVFGGRRISGFLVVADSAPLRNDVPTLHLADFDALIKRSHVESYQELLHPVVPPLPFGFVFAPRLESGSASSYQYIVPADVVERREVSAWRFQFKRWGYKPSGYHEYWFYVSKAEPLRAVASDAPRLARPY